MCVCFLKLVCPKNMSHSKLPITWMDVWWLNVVTLNPGGFLSHGGTPIAGRFLMENPTSRVDDLGIILWLWKPLHIYIYIFIFGLVKSLDFTTVKAGGIFLRQVILAEGQASEMAKARSKHHRWVVGVIEPQKMPGTTWKTHGKTMTGWWFQTCFVSHFIYGIILPIDFHIFQDG